MQSKPTITRFIDAIKLGVESWEEAGRILVSLRGEDENVFGKIIHEYPFVNSDTLEIFYLFGVKSLHPLTALLPRHVFGAVRQMPYEKQVKLLNEPVEVVTRMAGDKPVVVRKAITKLTAAECKTALWRKGNRSVEKQIQQLSEPVPMPEPIKVAPSRVAKEVARFSVRRGVGGSFVFEKTTAAHVGEQRIILNEGQALVVLAEYPKP